MIKQKLSISLSLIFTVAGAIVGTPTIANAGETVVEGSSIESSSFSGDSFNPENQAPNQTSAVDPDINIGFNGNINVSPAAQERLNKAANKILTRTGTEIDSNPNSLILLLLLQDSNNQNLNGLKISLQNSGLSASNVNTLLDTLAGLLQGFTNADTIIIGIEQPDVNINRLNAAVKIYNRIILKSDIKTLQKLASNSDFITIRQIINELRTAIKAG